MYAIAYANTISLGSGKQHMLKSKDLPCRNVMRGMEFDINQSIQPETSYQLGTVSHPQQLVSPSMMLASD